MPVLARARKRVTDRWLSGQKQQTVNLPTHAVYGGSNPPLSTRKSRNSKTEIRKSNFANFEFRISICPARFARGAGVTQW